MTGDLFDYMRWTLYFGKFVGIMPIADLKSSGKNTRFTWKSVCAFIYVINFMLLTFVVGIQIYDFMCSSFDMTSLNKLIFFVVHYILSVLLFRFCQRFSHFLTTVQSVEKLLPSPWKPRSSVKLANRLFVVVAIFGIAEDLSFTLFSIYLTNLCFRLEGDSGWYIQSYLIKSFRWYFHYFPFSYVAPAIFQVVKFQAGAMWFYGNWVIMVASIYLRNRFEDFNRLIIDDKSMFKKNFKPSWSELQVHYNRLSKLVAIFDETFNIIVFVTYTSNLYFVCLDVYVILNILLEVNVVPKSDDCATHHRNDSAILMYQVFQTVSMSFRTALFSYLAAEVHVASRRSLMVVHSAPPSGYSDMQRLLTQIYYSKLGVSGLNFFKITYGMLLAMVAKLLTYELVVVQF